MDFFTVRITDGDGWGHEYQLPADGALDAEHTAVQMAAQDGYPGGYVVTDVIKW